MQQVVSSEELLAAALQVYEQGKHPLTAMFGRDETLNGAGYAIYCCFEVPEKRDVHIVKVFFQQRGLLAMRVLPMLFQQLPGMSGKSMICLAWCQRDIRICGLWCFMKAFQRIFILFGSQWLLMPRYGGSVNSKSALPRDKDCFRCL